MLGREVVEGEQRLAVLLQALGRLVVLDLVALDERVECGFGVGLRLRHPDLLQSPLGLPLLAYGEFVEDVGGLVHPAALLARLGPNFAERFPEAKRAIGDGQLRRDR